MSDTTETPCSRCAAILLQLGESALDVIEREAAGEVAQLVAHRDPNGSYVMRVRVGAEIIVVRS
jgi:hypothetical protein